MKAASIYRLSSGGRVNAAADRRGLRQTIRWRTTTSWIFRRFCASRWNKRPAQASTVERGTGVRGEDARASPSSDRESGRAGLPDQTFAMVAGRSRELVAGRLFAGADERDLLR